MRPRPSVRGRALLVLALTSTLVPLPSGAAAATCQTWSPPPQPRNVGADDNFINGLARISDCSLWAVGSWWGNGRPFNTLIQRWNGSAWKVLNTPQPGSQARLLGVTATSPSNAWAVGTVTEGSVVKTLILRWNGTVWKRQTSPSPGEALSELESVAATSATNAWAVGRFSVGGVVKTLILHWDGTAWRRQASPNPTSPTNQLHDVAAISSSSAVAVGFTNGGSPLVLHLRAGRWRRAPISGLMNTSLSGVAVARPNDLWAVGSRPAGAGEETVTLRWNGTAWRRVKSPNAGATYANLYDVDLVGSGRAWAVGQTSDGLEVHPLILYWNGSAWVRDPSFEFDGDQGSSLNGVAVLSSANVWAAGMRLNPNPRTFAVHCC